MIRLLLVAAMLGPVAMNAQVADVSPRQDQLYELLFREVVHYQRQVTKATIPNKQHFAEYHARTFHLGAQHAASLNAISTGCMDRVSVIDGEAGELIRDAKEKYRNAPRGILVPPPPAALTELQQQKTAIIDSAIDELRSKFGEGQFAFFDWQVRAYMFPSPNRPAQVVEIK